MNKFSVLFAAMLLALSPMQAQKVVEDNFLQLKVHFSTPDLQVQTIDVDAVNYSVLTIDGYALGGEIGSPALPQFTSMITIPFCKEMTIAVENAVYEQINLQNNDCKVFPFQPSRSKRDTVRHEIVLNTQVYAADNYFGQPLAQVEAIGVGRDRNLANLIFSPVAVNPVKNTVIVCRSADITVNYIGSDEQRTRDHFRRYFTPAFTSGKTLNQLIPAKDISMGAPLRMAVLAHSSLRCKKLEQFFEWKRLQGLRVDVYYVDELGLTTSASIADMMTDLYANATEVDPAPAFLLIVGDIAQVPSHNSRLIDESSWRGSYYDHVTDLYYTTWTNGDLIADCYQGRFSATDTATLGAIIDKTLLYEQYSFTEDSYLARAALISGIDRGYSNDYAYKYADPAMDYIAKYYLNHSTGYDSVVYFKNDTSIHADPNIVVSGSSKPNSTVSILKNYYDQGAGWINYSAHGDWDCWYRPSFTVSDVNNMTNDGMPSFMIGNCCLSSKFDKPTCFGEALIRKNNNAGAIGYIGGSNSTYWTEDFYWAVGVRNNIRGNMNATYNASNLGVYDRLFHTHGEEFGSVAIATAGQIVFAGNMSVEGSTSSLKDYYWEIYHLFGDPSLIPWLGRAAEPYITFLHGSQFMIQTMPHAYVAIVGDELVAGFSDADGRLQLPIPQGDLSNYMVSVTAQGYKPFYNRLNEVSVPTVGEVPVSVYPNPATDGWCTIEAENLQRVTLLDLTGRTLLDKVCTGYTTNLDLATVARGIYMLRIETASGSAIKKIVR